MVERIRNPNRNIPRPQVPYVPEYRRHGVRPVPIDEHGRVQEEQLDTDESVSYGGGLPLNVGAYGDTAFNNNASFAVDGDEIDDEYDQSEERHVPPPQAPRRGPSTQSRKQAKKNPTEIEPGEYLLIVGGQIVGSGSEEHIKRAVTSLVYNQSLNPSDLIVLKRMEVDFGVTIK